MSSLQYPFLGKLAVCRLRLNLSVAMTAALACSLPTHGLAKDTDELVVVRADAASSTDNAADGVLTAVVPVSSARVTFDPAMLMGSINASDLSRFAVVAGGDPGVYDADILVNGEWFRRDDIRMAMVDGQVQYCADRLMLDSIGIDWKKVGGQTAETGAVSGGDDDGCVPIMQIVPEATARFDRNALRLDITIPQAWLNRQPRGYVDPSQWDKGVDAAFLRYNASYFYSNAGGKARHTGFGGLKAGLNLGDWHFRHTGSLIVPPTGKAKYQNIGSFVSRDIVSLKSRLLIGDGYTDGAIFQTTGFRGAQLASSDEMYPYSQQGYAPMIRGTARTNARVSVTQNGTTLYETTVAPGPFVIDDLYGTGYGANLIVTVTEADGSVSRFTVPYSSMPQLVRDKRLRYSVVGGMLRRLGTSARPYFASGTLQYGLANSVTVYGGVQVSRGYGAAVLGSAVATPIGSFSLDLTGSSTKLETGESKTGKRIRLAYSTVLAPTRTSLGIAAFLQTSRGFRDLDTYTVNRYDAPTQPGVPIRDRERQTFQLTLSQDLGAYGSLYVAGNRTRYWEVDETALSIQAGYATNFRVGGTDLRLNVDYSHQRDLRLNAEGDRFMVTVSIPFGQGANRPTLSASAMHNTNGNDSQSLRLYGSALRDSRLNYGVSVERDSDRALYSGNVQYRSSPILLNASAGFGDGSKQASLGASGGIVLHGGGLTMVNDLGDTFGIVQAKGAKGARIQSGYGTSLSGAGYGVVPYLTPYKVNDVTLDTSKVGGQVQLRNNSAHAIPMKDAIALVKFATVEGDSAVVTITMSDGSPPPFGARIVDQDGADLGAVGQGGRALVGGLKPTGHLQLILNEDSDARCGFDYALPKSSEKSEGFAAISVNCTMQPLNEKTAPVLPDVAMGRDSRHD